MSERPQDPYRTIVVGFDGSDTSRDALALAGSLAAATGATVVAAAVCELPSITWPIEDDWVRENLDQARENLSGAGTQGLVDPAFLETQVVEATSTPRGLHALAEKADADLIVVGSADGGRAGQVLPGSVGRRLLHGSRCAVAVAPTGFAARERAPIAQIVVGFNGSPESLHALEGAVALAEATGAHIRLAVVAERPRPAYGKGGGMAGVAELEEAIAQHMEEQLEIGMAQATGQQIEGSVVHGDPAVALHEAAADADLLMVGSRAYGPLRTVLLGSVSAKLIQAAPCAVIVYPRGAEGVSGEHDSLAESAAADGAL